MGTPPHPLLAGPEWLLAQVLAGRSDRDIAQEVGVTVQAAIGNARRRHGIYREQVVGRRKPSRPRAIPKHPRRGWGGCSAWTRGQGLRDRASMATAEEIRQARAEAQLTLLRVIKDYSDRPGLADNVYKWAEAYRLLDASDRAATPEGPGSVSF